MAISLVLYAISVFADDSDFVTPFSTVLGSNSGVAAYSNGNSDNISGEYNELSIIRSGVKWQCVEYSRRWLILTKKLSFDPLPCASDIWHLDSLLGFEYYPFTYPTPLNRVPNGSKCSPKAGNLVIYSRGGPGMTYGHVAIITHVDTDYVLVAEQNWDNDYWPGNYARKLKMDYSNGSYTIYDEEHILGWMAYEEYDHACFDAKCSTCSSKNTDMSISCTYS